MYSNTGATNVVAAVELTSTLQCVQNLGAGSEASLGIIYTLQNKLVLPLRLAAGSVAREFPFRQLGQRRRLLRDSVAAQGAGAQIDQSNSAADGAGGLLLGGGYYGTAAVVNTALLPEQRRGWRGRLRGQADAAGGEGRTRSRRTAPKRAVRVSSVSCLWRIAGTVFHCWLGSRHLGFRVPGRCFPSARTCRSTIPTSSRPSRAPAATAVWATRFCVWGLVSHDRDRPDLLLHPVRDRRARRHYQPGQGRLDERRRRRRFRCPIRPLQVVVFDFDGTLVSRDSFIDFSVRYCLRRPWRLLLVGPLLPFALLWALRSESSAGSLLLWAMTVGASTRSFVLALRRYARRTLPDMPATRSSKS